MKEEIEDNEIELKLKFKFDDKDNLIIVTE